MLGQLALGSALILLTTAIHSGCTWTVLRMLHKLHADAWVGRSPMRAVSLVTWVVLMMFLAAIIEAGVWAAVYLAVGAIPDLETSLYFSTVTFTTLGYGDVTLHADWRLLAACQSANGTIMFGWTTAIVMAVIHRMASEHVTAKW